MKPAIYLAFVIFFVFIGTIIYEKSMQKNQEEKAIISAPCKDTKTFQDIKQNSDKLDNLIIEKCEDNQK